MTERICEWCGLPYYPKHGNQKYCNDDCARYAELENTRIRMHKYRKLAGYGNKKTYPFGGLGPHPKDDFDAELQTYRMPREGIHP